MILVYYCRDMSSSAVGPDEDTMGIQLVPKFRIRTSLEPTVVLFNPDRDCRNKKARWDLDT